MNGVNEKISYYLLFGYLDDEGYIVKFGFICYFVCLCLEYQFNKNIKMGGNFVYVNIFIVVILVIEE